MTEQDKYKDNPNERKYKTAILVKVGKRVS